MIKCITITTLGFSVHSAFLTTLALFKTFNFPPQYHYHFLDAGYSLKYAKVLF